MERTTETPVEDSHQIAFLYHRVNIIIGLEKPSELDELASPELIQATDNHAKTIAEHLKRVVKGEDNFIPGQLSRGESLDQFNDAWTTLATPELVARIEEIQKISEEWAKKVLKETIISGWLTKLT